MDDSGTESGAARQANAAEALPVLCLAGPTACGKSVVALALAETLGGEIITVDSMQVYRGLDIGTAKPSRAERSQVPHHLIDVVDLSGSFDAAEFVRLAGIAVAEIRQRRRVPILCGGTGLYFKAFFDGLGESPPANAALRQELEATPLAELLCELERRDPATFATIDRANPRRVIRAVEVMRLTGKAFASQRSAWSPQESSRITEHVSPCFGLTRSNEDLRHRIDARVDAMFERGLVEETRTLLARGLERNRTAMQAIGYRQVVEYLRGGWSLEATIARVKQRTRQFARRQMTWFRHQMPLEWMTWGPGEPATVIADRLAARYAQHKL